MAFCCISSAEVATPPALAALPGREEHAGLAEDAHGLRACTACSRPRRPRSRRSATSVAASRVGQLVLRRARQRDVDGGLAAIDQMLPPARYSDAVPRSVGVVGDAAALDLLDLA